MGMFDEIVVEYPLPDGWRPSERLQTKDFECFMEVYELRADGTLWQRQVRMEDNPDYVPAETDSSMTRLINSRRRVVLPPVRVPLHGIFRMYGYEQVADRETGDTAIWHDYRVKFTDGLLVEIVNIEESADGA